MINRIMIIGNGFDLAHGLKTSYKDFMEDYFLNIDLDNWEDEFLQLNGNGKIIKDIKNYEELMNYFKNEYYGEGKGKENYWPSFLNRYSRIFKNKLFEDIVIKNRINNWVDIEYEYFIKLIGIIKTKDFNNNLANNEFRNMFYKKSKETNQNLDSISKILIDYLNQIQVNISKEKFNDRTALIFKGKQINNDLNFESFKQEFSSDKWSRLWEKRKERIIDKSQLIPAFDKTIVLNFNYTQVASNLYGQNCLNIHGTLDDPSSIVFGYGDEMVADYADLENLNDNEFLRHMKSTHYGKNENYRQLMTFAEDGPFQVQILGHSCGISDRTLLSSLFEHPNCWSIKPYYHQMKDGEGNIIGDNYQEIYMNISRHFKDKVAMRNKVVNKELCQPLPQWNDKKTT